MRPLKFRDTYRQIRYRNIAARQNDHTEIRMRYAEDDNDRSFMSLYK